MCSGHDERKTQNPFNSAEVHSAHLKCSWRSKVLDALSCYLMLNTKNIVDQNLKGRAPVASPGSATVSTNAINDY